MINWFGKLAFVMSTIAPAMGAFRKRFATLIATEILVNEAVSVQLIQHRAARYTSLDGLQTRGPANSRQLVLPPERARLEKLLRLMREDFFVGALTGKEKLANSSRILAPATE